MNATMKKISLAAAALAIFALTAVATPAQDASQGSAPVAAKAAKAPKAPKFEGKVNINSATAEQLEALPRVGPKMALRIVEYRQSHKGFKSVDELRNVKGIGAKILEQLRPYLSV